MRLSSNGRRILADKPRVSASTIKISELRQLTENTFGYKYALYMDSHGFDPDERDAVQHLEDKELAYVMQRYREVHDFWHVLCNHDASVAGEIAIKWFEMVQTGLPVATISALFGPLRILSSCTETGKLFSEYIPWAVRSASNAEYLMNVYYEEHFRKDIDEFRKELSLEPYAHNDKN